MPPYNKNRSKVACAACRARKTKCDGARPKCAFCQENGCACTYMSPQGPSMENNIETILSKISKIESYLGAGAAVGAVSPPVSVSSMPSDDSKRQEEEDRLKFPFLTIKDSQFANIVFNVDFNLSLYARNLEGEHSSLQANNEVAIVRHTVQELAQFFFCHTYNWFPIFSKREILEDKLHVIHSTTRSNNPETFLLLMILAIGGVNANDSVGTLQAQEFHAHALSMLGCVLEDLSLCSIQCLVLLSLYYGLKVQPTKAQQYVNMGAVKMQHLIKLLTVDNPINEESNDPYDLGIYETRAFWALFILQSEYAGTLHHVDTGLSSYAGNVKFPSLVEDWPESDSLSNFPDPHFLSEIGVRKIIDRTSYTFKISESFPSKGTSFAPIVAEELMSQLDEWYLTLPESIKFDKLQPHDMDEPRYHGSRKFIKGQYFATVILLYWPCILDIIATKGQCQSEDYKKAFNIVVDSYVQFMLSATTIELAELPLIWTHAISIFAMTATILRMNQVSTFTYDKPEEFESGIEHAFNFLASVEPRSPSIRYFTMMLRELYNSIYNN